MYTRLLFVSMLLLADTAAAQSSATFSVPCQEREVFLSRLRTLIDEPRRAEAALEQFAIQIAPDADGSWILTVSQPGNPQTEPRTLRQASCSELAEAATLVVATWLDESIPPPPPPPAAPPEPAAAPEPAEPDPAAPEERSLQLGVSLNCDGALAMMPSASIGGSVSIWFLSADRKAFTSFGVSAWPTHRREDSEFVRYAEYERPTWTFYVQQIRFWVDADPVQLGLFGGAYMGGRRSNDGLDDEFTFGLSGGAAMRWTLGKSPLALRFQAGISASMMDRKTAAIAALAIDLAFN